MIIAKPFTIAAGALPAGGSSYSIGGTKFFLLAASEPLNVQLFRGATLVGDLSGFNGGLSAGPFCEAFTSFSLSTQSGLAGNALIGVGDEALDYNPLAGSLSFSTSQTNAQAIPAASLTDPATAQSQRQQNYTITNAFLAVVGDYDSLAIGNGGYANGKTITVKSVVITNPNAAAQSVQLGTAIASGGGADLTPINLYAGGAPSAFYVTRNVGHMATPPFNLVKEVQVPANGQLTVDLSLSPIVCPKGVAAIFWMQSMVTDIALTYEINWSES